MKKVVSIFLFLFFLVSCVPSNSTGLKKEFYDNYKCAAEVLLDNKVETLSVPSINEEDLEIGDGCFQYDMVVLWVAYLLEKDELVIDDKAIPVLFGSENEPDEGLMFFEKVEQFYVVDIYFSMIGQMVFFVNAENKDNVVIYALYWDLFMVYDSKEPLGYNVIVDSETHAVCNDIITKRLSDITQKEKQDTMIDVFPDYKKAFEEAYGVEVA